MDNFSTPDTDGKEAEFGAPSVHAPSDWLDQFQHCLKPARTQALFAFPHRTAEAYPTMRLRAFGKRKAGATPILIVAPFAAHDAGFVDLMRGHSLVQTLCGANAGVIYLTDWNSASPDLASASIDSYLSDLNVAIDDLGGAVHVVGLGVGGSLALIHAARFPGKIARLVLAGTPVDVSVRPSLMTRLARKAIECDELPDEDAVCGTDVFSPLSACHGQEHATIQTMQRNPGSFARADLDALAAFENWAARKVDLPARYAREMLTLLFAGNQLARGEFVALGRAIDLRKIAIPLFVLAGARDDVTPKLQALSVLNLVATAKARRRSLVAPCGHYALFVGAGTLSREWRTIAGWLTSSAPAAKRRTQTIAGKDCSKRP